MKTFFSDGGDWQIASSVQKTETLFCYKKNLKKSYYILLTYRFWVMLFSIVHVVLCPPTTSCHKKIGGDAQIITTYKKRRASQVNQARHGKARGETGEKIVVLRQ